VIGKTYVEPLTDEHSKNLESTIGGTDAKSSTLMETAQDVAVKAGEIAGQVKETVVNAAANAYEAVAGKK
jgi:hypothetical protein